MIMTKYEQTKKYDVAGNVETFGSQGIFSIEGVEESGIFALTENRYSKTYVLSDINFAGVTDIEQKEIIIGFSKVLKAFPAVFHTRLQMNTWMKRSFMKTSFTETVVMGMTI